MQNETVYTNAPLNRFSLGIIAGGMLNPSGDDRVKLSDEGKVGRSIEWGSQYRRAVHPPVEVLYWGGFAVARRATSEEEIRRAGRKSGFWCRDVPDHEANPANIVRPTPRLKGFDTIGVSPTFNVGYAAMIVDKTATLLNTIGGAPHWARTCDLRLRKLALYPTVDENRIHKRFPRWLGRRRSGSRSCYTIIAM